MKEPASLNASCTRKCQVGSAAMGRHGEKGQQLSGETAHASAQTT